jgi:two-component system cell cycle sensor histidine kinase/response regulator CckA
MDRQKILIVNDIPENLELFYQILKADYVVLGATHGKESLVITREHRPDLILLDIMMPGMDGYAVLAELRKDEKTRDIPVIFLTMLDDAVDEEKGLRLGAVDYISTSASPAIILARVRTHLSIKEAQDRLAREIEERKKIEQALGDSEVKYRSLVETTSDCIWEFDAAGRFTYLSPRFTDITGYKPEAFIGKRPLDLLPEDEAPQTGEKISSVIGARQPFASAVNPIWHKEGKRVFVEISGIPVFSPDGLYRGFRGITRDISTRKKADDAFNLHLAVTETVAEGVFLIGVDDNIIKWTNGKFEQMFGYEPGEMVGMHVDRVNAPTEKTPTETRISIVNELLQITEWHGEIKSIKKDGTHFWCHVRVSLFDHPQFGKVMVSAHTDITERKLADAALRDSEEMFHAIFDHTLDGILFTSPDGPIFAANAAACLMSGWSDQEICEGGRNRIIDTTDPRLPAALEERRRTGRFQGELTFKRNDGSTFPVDLSSSLFTLHNGKHRTCIIFRDITKRKRLEQELQLRERYLRTIINNIPSLVAYWDKNLHNRFANHTYKVWFGIEPDKIPGMHFKDLIGEELFRTRLPYIEAVLAGQPQIFERTISFPDGADIKHSLFHYIPDVSDGQVQGFYVMVSDITHIKIAEEQRKQFAKAESLNRMAGAIAHHFNNQLYAVMGNLELLMDSEPPGSEKFEMLTGAMTASHKAADISRMMLTYLGQSHDKQELQDLSEICHKGLLMAESFIPNNVSVNMEIPFPGPTVCANTQQIHQIIINLITNAWESIADHPGAITLSVKTVSAVEIPNSNRFPDDWKPKESTAYACLEIIDTGSGIPKEHIDKIFDPFFTTKFTGRGLGLSVVLGILATHSGTITVENRAGGGCVFKIFLPAVSRTLPVAVDAKEKKATEGIIQTGGTVLLIDDEEQVRRMARVMLTHLGYTVIEAKDGMEALELFPQHQDEIRCVLTDLTMPRMSGWETLAALRNLSPDIPVILSSGYDEAQVMAEEHPDRPNAFLGKPFHLKELRETITRVLSTPVKDK